MFIVLSIVLLTIDAQKFKASAIPIIIMMILSITSIFLIRAGKFKTAAYSMLTKMADDIALFVRNLDRPTKS